MELSDVMNEMFPPKAQAEEIRRAAFATAVLMGRESMEYAELAKDEFDSLLEYLDKIIKS